MSWLPRLTSHYTAIFSADEEAECTGLAFHAQPQTLSCSSMLKVVVHKASRLPLLSWIVSSYSLGLGTYPATEGA